MQKSTFSVPKMDCPSEVALIRTKLDGFDSIQSLEFDITSRKVGVYHLNEADRITTAMEELGLSSKLIETLDGESPPANEEGLQKKALYSVLGINFAFFLAEFIAGLISRSMGLVADSLDMLADALVYGLSIWAVGKAAGRKKLIARISGFLQLGLAIIGFGEVLRRFVSLNNPPEFRTMITVSSLAMIANVICLVILMKARSREAHMQASMIFTSNDVVINAGVITAGILVYLVQSNKPDLIAGAVVFLIVIAGAFRILKLSK